MTAAGMLVAGYHTRSRLFSGGEQAVFTPIGDTELSISVLDLHASLPLPDFQPLAELCNKFPGLIPKPIRVMAYLLRE